MNVREMKRRLAALEKKSQVDCWLTLTFADGTQTKILGRTTHWERIRDLLIDPEEFEATRMAGIRQMAHRDLDQLRRAVNIEGTSAQMFGLLQAMARGPAETETG